MAFFARGKALFLSLGHNGRRGIVISYACPIVILCACNNVEHSFIQHSPNFHILITLEERSLFNIDNLDLHLHGNLFKQVKSYAVTHHHHVTVSRRFALFHSILFGLMHDLQCIIIMVSDVLSPLNLANYCRLWLPLSGTKLYSLLHAWL